MLTRARKPLTTPLRPLRSAWLSSHASQKGNSHQEEACLAAPLLATNSVRPVSSAPTAAPPVDDGPPTPIECGASSQEFSDTVPVVGNGATQLQAYLDLWAGGMDDELMAAANVKCDACTPEKDCEASVDFRRFRVSCGLKHRRACVDVACHLPERGRPAGPGAPSPSSHPSARRALSMFARTSSLVSRSRSLPCPS